MCSDSMPSMKGDCPICDKIGYLILEKPRAKNHKPYWRHTRRNKPTKSYDTSKRLRRPYYKFSHYNSNPCYIGCLTFALGKLEKISQILEDGFDSRSDDFKNYTQQVKEDFNKNYKLDPKDSKYIYSVIKEARKFRIVFDQKLKAYKLR